MRNCGLFCFWRLWGAPLQMWNIRNFQNVRNFATPVRYMRHLHQILWLEFAEMWSEGDIIPNCNPIPFPPQPNYLFCFTSTPLPPQPPHFLSFHDCAGVTRWPTPRKLKIAHVFIPIANYRKQKNQGLSKGRKTAPTITEQVHGKQPNLNNLHICRALSRRPPRCKILIKIPITYFPHQRKKNPKKFPCW